jgi:uncharacterized membrane protein YqiK
MDGARIAAIAQQIIESRLCATVSTMTAEDVLYNRAAFSASLADESALDLATMGLVVDSLSVRDIEAQTN